MLFFDGALGLIVFALWLFCIIDVITTPDGAARHLPKLVWLLLVIVLMDIGAVLWLVAGRPWSETDTRRLATATGGRRQPAGRAPAVATNPDDDEQFLAGLKARAEQQRRRARETGEAGTDLPG